MGSVSFSIIISGVDEDYRDDLIGELADFLDIPFDEAEELISSLPTTVARGLDEDEADEMVEVLATVGAKVKLVEVESRRRGRRRPRAPEPIDDEDELDEEEEETPRRRRSPPRDRRSAQPPPNQRIMLIAGIVILALLMGLLAFSTLGGRSAGCGGGDFRGPGADPELTRFLPQIAQRYAHNFVPEGEVAHGNLPSGESAKMIEDIPGGRCYTWIGLSPEGTDLDLYLRQGNKLIGRDDADDRLPVVRHCVMNDADVELEIKMFAGGGDWVVQRYALEGPEGADLLTLLQQLYVSIYAATSEEVAPPKRLTLRAGEEREIKLRMSAEWCYLAIAVSEPGTDLDMVLYDPQDREIKRDQAPDNFPLANHCPTEDGTYKVKLQMYHGGGDAIYQVFRNKMQTGGMGQ